MRVFKLFFITCIALLFCVKGLFAQTWTVVVTNSSGGAGGVGNAATFPVNESGSLPAAATPTTDLSPPTFDFCYGVAIHPSGRTAYVVNSNNNSVSAIDIPTNTVRAFTIVGSTPNFIAINSLGTRAYVTNKADGTISVLNIAGGNEQAPVVVGSAIDSDSGGTPTNYSPTGIAISSDNSTLYVINEGTLHLVSFSLSNPDIPAFSVAASIPGPSGNFHNYIAVTPTNSKVYINDQSANLVYAYYLYQNENLIQH